jgi:hypothetical protein
MKRLFLPLQDSIATVLAPAAVQKGLPSRGFSVSECFRNRVSPSKKSIGAKPHGKHKPSRIVTRIDSVNARSVTAFRGFQSDIMVDVILC